MMLTNREKYLVKEAYMEGFDKGWYTDRDKHSSRESFFTNSEVHELCKNWLNEEVANGDITVEVVMSHEAGKFADDLLNKLVIERNDAINADREIWLANMVSKEKKRRIANE